MKAITFHGIREVRCEQIDDPALLAPTDVIVKVELAAVCGSDLHPYRGREPGLDPGTVMGHEFLGEVVEIGAEIGAEIEHLQRGQRVVSPFTTSCGRCRQCQRGLTARCESGQLFGWREAGVGLHGTQAEYARVPLADSTLVRLPDGAPEEAALFAGDILSTGLFCAERGGVGPGDVVCVLGCGPVGLMAVIAAQELGAERVYAVDGIAERLQLAAGFGARTIDLAAGSAGVRSVVMDATHGQGGDVILEVVGSPEATRLAYELVRPGGTISAAGVHTEERFAFAPGEAYDKNLTYSAGRCPARAYMERALAIVAAGVHDLTAVISHRMTLADGPLAYELFDQRRDGCTKVLLSP